MQTLKRLLYSAIGAGIGFIPLWIFLFAKNALNPEGFWEKLAVTGLGIVALGGIQLFLFIVLCWLLYTVWTSRV